MSIFCEHESDRLKNYFKSGPRSLTKHFKFSISYRVQCAEDCLSLPYLVVIGFESMASASFITRDSS